MLTWEKGVLEKFADVYHLGKEWYSADDYVKFLESHGLQDIKYEDWSQNISHYTPALVRAFFLMEGPGIFVVRRCYRKCRDEQHAFELARCGTS